MFREFRIVVGAFGDILTSKALDGWGSLDSALEGLGCADLLSLRPSTKDVVVSQKGVSNIDPNILFSLL